MPDLELKKYSPVNPVLKKLIKYYWVMKSNTETAVHGKLIPMNNIDLIINLSSPIIYKNKTKEESFKSSHFTGIQNNFRTIQQQGILDIVGISYYPAGFYPFIKIPVSEFENAIISIDNILDGFEKKIETLSEIESNHHRVSVIEEILMNYIDLNLLPPKAYESFTHDFMQYGDSININNYCKKHGISQKTLERFFYKYVGTTPKAFLMTTRFQETIKRLKTGDFDSMTQLGYEFNYYDQTHFINSFKSFMGKTPAKQFKDNDLIIDILSKR